MKSLLAVFLVLCCLTGCSGSKSGIEPGLLLRKKLNAGTGCSFDVTITADYTDKIYTFGMNCKVDENGKLDFTVTAPESIAGISGTVSESGAGLTFDNQILACEMLADSMISPVISPWLMIRSIRGGYISACSESGDKSCIRIDDSFQGSNLQTVVWVDKQLLLCGAEFLYSGKRILSLEVANFVIL